MRAPRVSMAFVGLGMAAGAAAQAQTYGAQDPCRPAPVYGSAINLLVTALMQQQRAQACAAERQAQWTAYNAQKKADQDKAAADAAQKQQVQAQQAATAETQRQEAAAQATRRQRDRAAADQAARRRRDQAAAQARVDRREEEAQRRLQYLEQIKAERSPDNTCHEPKLARAVLEGWSNLDAMKDQGIKAIDIEHLTTVYFHPDSVTFSCHGIFVTNKGWKIAGTVELRKNVAGDPLFSWSRDGSQDLSFYEAPAPADAGSPEMGGQATLGSRVPEVVPAALPNAPDHL